MSWLLRKWSVRAKYTHMYQMIRWILQTNVNIFQFKVTFVFFISNFEVYHNIWIRDCCRGRVSFNEFLACTDVSSFVLCKSRSGKRNSSMSNEGLEINNIIKIIRSLVDLANPLRFHSNFNWNLFINCISFTQMKVNDKFIYMNNWLIFNKKKDNLLLLLWMMFYICTKKKKQTQLIQSNFYYVRKQESDYFH